MAQPRGQPWGNYTQAWQDHEMYVHATREFQRQIAQRVKELSVRDKRRLLHVTRYGNGGSNKTDSFPRGEDNLNVFFPQYGLFGADVLCHHILK
jgi:hypothetical protein